MDFPLTDAHTHFRYPQSGDVKFVRNAFLLKTAGRLPYTVCCGLHPWKVTENWETHIEHLKHLAVLPNVVAIGECGLDYARQVSRELQQQAFEAQIHIAHAVRKPLVLHIVKALYELPRFLKSAQVAAVLHGYSGNEKETQQLLHLNVLFSIGTRMLRQPEKLREILQTIPPEKLLFETDTRRNNLQQLYSTAAQIYKCEENVLRKQVFSNFAATFLTDERA
ncbi:MAG: TatD family hydrolase [Bacteroidia bacterium]